MPLAIHAGTGESGVGEYDGFVSNIHICDTHIDGPVPRELCAFHRLRELDLDGGQLTGPIPEWLVGPQHQWWCGHALSRQHCTAGGVHADDSHPCR
jgi:hypothetical protein